MARARRPVRRGPAPVAGVTGRLPAVSTLVTGGAGFIGGELVASLLADGAAVTVLDDLSTAAPDWFDRFTGGRRPRFILGDAADPATVDAAMAGQRRVVHLASGTDIAGGFGHPERDFRSGVVATEVVCESMLRHGVRDLWYASSGVVYGEPARTPTGEGDGPFQPASHYAAAKLAGEAIISGFAQLYGWRALTFRFGNTVGARSDHGIVHDLVVKLLRDPDRVEVLGDGLAAKPYVAVSDLVAGMRCVAVTVGDARSTTVNLGPSGTVAVQRVVELVIDAVVGKRDVRVTFRPATAAGGGWPGDTPVVDFDTSLARRFGWVPSMSGEAAIRSAASGIATRYRASGAPLVTALERRAEKGGGGRQPAAATA